MAKKSSSHKPSKSSKSSKAKSSETASRRAADGAPDDPDDLAFDEGDYPDLFALDLEVVGAHLPIWRRVLVPSDLAVDELHFLISMVFDWPADADYYFTQGDVRYESMIPDDLEDDEEERAATRRRRAEGVLDSTEVPLDVAFPHLEDRMDYFTSLVGEDGKPEASWHILITHRYVMPDDLPFDLLPVCLTGEGAEPPFESGGVEYYEDLCEALADPRSPRHRAARSWLGLRRGEEYDPEAFDWHDANFELAYDQISPLASRIVPDDPDQRAEMILNLVSEQMVGDAGHALDMISTRMGIGGRELSADDIDQDAFDDAIRHGLEKALQEFGVAPEEIMTLFGGAGQGAAAEQGAAAGRDAAERDAAGADGDAGAKPVPFPSVVPGASRGTAASASQPSMHVEAGFAECLKIFQEALCASGLADRTVNKHIDNVLLFGTVYLPQSGLTVREGCYRLDDYFGFYLPSDPLLSATALKDATVSIRKFYKALLDAGVVSAADYEFVQETIRDYRDEWLEDL